MPPRKPSAVGCHVQMSARPNGAAYARLVGADVIQVFLSNPRGWSPGRPAPEADALFATQCHDDNVAVFAHAPYLINLASPRERTREQSADALRHSLDRGTRCGVRGVVVHAGSAVDAAYKDTALQQMREVLLPLLDDLSAEAPDILIEPTAGGGESMASTVEDLAPLFDALQQHPRLGVCLDICHAYAAGHDVAKPGGIRTTLNALVRAVGRGRLRLVHANDSKDALGSRRDRHARVGTGTIGIEPFAELFRHPATRGVPVLIETPGGPDGHRADIAQLKALRDT